jgi:hypothetical protein
MLSSIRLACAAVIEVPRAWATNAEVCAVVCTVGLFTASLAHADPPNAKLTWHAPAECPRAHRVLDMLRNAERPTGALTIWGTVTRTDDDFALDLRVRAHGQRFERKLRAPDCEALAETAVFLIELAATQLSAAAADNATSTAAQHDSSAATAASATADRDGSAAAHAPAANTSESLVTAVAPGSDENPSESPAAASGSAAASRDRSAETTAFTMSTRELLAAPSRERSTAAADEPPAAISGEHATLITAPRLDLRRRRAPVESETAADGGDVAPEAMRWGVMVSLGFGVVGLTGVAPDAALGVALRLAQWDVGLRVGMLFHPSLALAEAAELGLRSAYLQLYGCRAWRRGPLRTGPCAVVGSYVTFVTARGLEAPRAQSELWASAGGAWQVALSVSAALTLGLEAGFTAALSARPSYHVSGADVTRVDPVAGYGRLAYSVAW